MRGLATIWAAALCAVYAGGCSGQCGLIVQPGAMSDGGFAAFYNVPVGTSTMVNVPIQDSANVDETVTGSAVTGSDAAAFKVLSTFPMSLPAGNSVSVAVEFTPQHAGTSTASLVLDTANMGPSPIQLEGSGY
jgi:hypothetical protein